MATLACINPFKLDLFNPLKKKKLKKISQILDSRLVVFLETKERDEAIDVLVEILDAEGKLPDKKLFRTAIFQRETVVSTGIGLGVAIPHAKMQNFSDFFIAIGIQSKQSIEWNALDHLPVRIVLMIGGPEEAQAEYLKILSQLTYAIKNVDLRKSLLKAESPEQVLLLFSDF